MLSMAGSSLFAIGENTWRPHADMYETPEEILLIIDLAGVRREDIHLEVSRRTIKIFGKRDQMMIPGTTRYRLAEIPYGYFERHLSLPAAVDTDRVEATHRNGLLEVRMTKLPPGGEVRKKIPVSRE